MGIRFACHHCNHGLNLKDFQAGKRGKCPACSKTFRIPRESCDFSIPLEESDAQQATTAPAIIGAQAKSTSSRGPVEDAGPQNSSRKSEVATKSKQKIAVKNRALSPLTSPVSSQVADARERAKTSPSAELGTVVVPSKPIESSDSEQSVAVFQANPLAQWYVRPPSGGQYGPADSNLLSQWISENRVTIDSLIWFDGLTQWTPAGTVIPELFGGIRAASPGANVTNEFPSPRNANDGLASGGELVNTASLEMASRPIRTRQKQKRNQWIIIALLVSTCLCLLVGLVAVLMFKK